MSASSATDPDNIATTSWIAAVSASPPSEIQVARVPARVASNAASAGPKCSWSWTAIASTVTVDVG